MLVACQSSAQKLTSYDQKGNKLKTVTEYVSLTVTNQPPISQPAAPSSFIGVVLGPVYNIASGLVKDGIEKRKKSYVATYSNSSSFNSDELNRVGQKKRLILKRYAINDLGGLKESNLMAEYTFLLLPSTAPDQLEIQLETILLKRSKARYHADNNLSIGITIKTSARQKKSSVQENDEDTKLETLSGEGLINIPILKVNNDPQNLGENEDIINKIRLKDINFKTLIDIQFAISITETNISHIDPGIAQNLVTNNSSDLQTILKAIFKVNDK